MNFLLIQKILEMDMQMTLTWSYKVVLYVNIWDTQGEAGWFFLSCFAVFLIGFGYEGWSFMMEHWGKNAVHRMVNDMRSMQRYDSIDDSEHIKNSKMWRIRCCLELQMLKRTCFYVLKLFLVYLLMLSIMTYNGGIIISVFSGYAAGNYVVTRFQHNTQIDTRDLELLTP